MSSYASTLIAEIKSHGVTDYSIVVGGKHPRLRFVYNAREIAFVFPSTPSDGRGIYNALSTLRRMMDVRRKINKSERRQKSRRKTGSQGSAVAPIPASFVVRHNPFDQLAPLLERLSEIVKALPPGR